MIAFSAANIGPIGNGGNGIGKLKPGNVNLQQGRPGKTGGGGKLIVIPRVGAKIGGKETAGILKLRQGAFLIFPIIDLHKLNYT